MTFLILKITGKGNGRVGQNYSRNTTNTRGRLIVYIHFLTILHAFIFL